MNLTRNENLLYEYLKLGQKDLVDVTGFVYRNIDSNVPITTTKVLLENLKRKKSIKVTYEGIRRYYRI